VDSKVKRENLDVTEIKDIKDCQDRKALLVAQKDWLVLREKTDLVDILDRSDQREKTEFQVRRQGLSNYLSI